MFKIGSIGISYIYNLLTEKKEDGDNSLVNNMKRLQVLRKTLEHHGGLFSKVSQMLAYGDTNCSVFSECKPYSREETKEYLKNYIKTYKPGYIIDLDVYKSGSIGQVHIGRFTEDKGKIAVKIQYVGLYEQTNEDINALKMLANFLYVFADIKEAIKDIKQKVYEELDYFTEANNHQFMYDNWKDSDIFIPKVYKALCTKKVLVTEFVDGVDLSTFIKNSTQEERNKIAIDLTKFMFVNIYNYGIFYSDSHYGNILIKEGNTLSVIDFGCVNYIDKKMLISLKKLHNSLKNEDKEMTINVLKELGILNDQVSSESLDYAYKYFRIQYTPWIVEEEFEFTQEWFEEADKKDVKLLSEWILPKNMVYFNKIPWGFYHILTALNAKGLFFKILNEIFDDYK